MFSGDFVPKVWIFRLLQRDLRKMTDMDNAVESMYEEAGRLIASCGRDIRMLMKLADFHEGLGDASELLDNVLYERMGMSCEEVIEALQCVIINKPC